MLQFEDRVILLYIVQKISGFSSQRKTLQLKKDGNN